MYPKCLIKKGLPRDYQLGIKKICCFFFCVSEWNCVFTMSNVIDTLLMTFCFYVVIILHVYCVLFFSCICTTSEMLYSFHIKCQHVLFRVWRRRKIYLYFLFCMQIQEHKNKNVNHRNGFDLLFHFHIQWYYFDVFWIRNRVANRKLLIFLFFLICVCVCVCVEVL